MSTVLISRLRTNWFAGRRDEEEEWVVAERRDGEEEGLVVGSPRLDSSFGRAACMHHQHLCQLPSSQYSSDLYEEHTCIADHNSVFVAGLGWTDDFFFSFSKLKS